MKKTIKFVCHSRFLHHQNNIYRKTNLQGSSRHINIALLFFCFMFVFISSSPATINSSYVIVVSKTTWSDVNWQAVVTALQTKYASQSYIKIYTGSPFPDTLRQQVSAIMPHYVCFVAKPEDVTRDYVARCHNFIRLLDDDAYGDAIWGIVTGLTANDALRIANADSFTVQNSLLKTAGGWLDYLYSGTYHSEGDDTGTMWIRANGGVIDKRTDGPTDDTQSLVTSLNSNNVDIMITSGHAWEYAWQLHYDVDPENKGPEGIFGAFNGQLVGQDFNGVQYNISSTNPKIYYGAGNCLIGHIPEDSTRNNCMVLGWLGTGGAVQFAGYTVESWFGYMGWGVADYFIQLQDRFTFAESVFLNNQALLFDYKNNTPGIDIIDPTFGSGLEYDRDVFAFYGDPALVAKLQSVTDPDYEQTLSYTRNGNTLEYTFNISMNRAVNPERPVIAWLPKRIKNPQIDQDDGCTVNVTDDMVLVRVWQEGDPDVVSAQTWTIQFTGDIDCPIPSFSIQAVAGAYGSISPVGTMAVAQGSDIHFTATPNSGYVVEQWYLNGFIIPGTEGATSYTLSNVQKDVSVIVLFKQSTASIGQLNITSSNPNTNVSIQVSPNDTIGQGAGNTPFSRTYNYNTSVTLTAPSTASGNTFLKWQKNYADFSTNMSITVAANANDIYTAIYSSVAQSETFNASADTWVYEASPDYIGGNSELLSIDDSDVYESYAYFNFKDNMLSVPAGSTINSAELRLSVQNYPNTGRRHLLGLFEVNSSWTEGTVKWNQKPTVGNQIDEHYTDQGDISVWIWPSGTFPGLKTIVEYWVNNRNENYGLAVRSYPGDSGAIFYSSEYGTSSKRPKLVINYTPPPMKNISGYITTSNGGPIAGVFLDSTGGTAITNADGYYSESVPVGWSGRFTPTKEGYNFNPSYIDYSSVSANMSNQNYTATLQQRFISGYIRTADGIAVGQVTIYANNGGGTVVSGADGSYAVPVPYGWTGQVVPGKSGYSFIPLYKDYSGVTVNQADQDYIGTVYTYTISGFIRTLSGNGYSEVTVSTSDGLSSTTTESSGFYSLVVGYGWTGVVTPTKEGCIFTPESKSYNPVTTNYLMQDYIIEPSADINNDNIVNLEDYVSVSCKWKSTCSAPNWCDGADIDHNEAVDLTDLMIMVGQWLEGTSLIPDDMIYIPGGTFQMGNSFSGEGGSYELPVHSVTLSPFYMGKYEITNDQYCDFLNSALSQGLITVSSNIVYKADSGTTYPYCDTYQSSNYSQINWDGSTFTVRSKSGRSMANDPIVEVSWHGAVAYCDWKSQQEGKPQCYNLSTWVYDPSKKGYHLPTEAQWEYAARGGLSGKRFPWGDDIYHTQANYNSSSSFTYDKSSTRGNHPIWNDGVYPYTSPVGFFDGTLKYKSTYNWPSSAMSYQTANGINGYGLYDMTGNVWEWCHDLWGSYSSGSQTNPTGPTTGTYRVLRGGDWSLYPNNCRLSDRTHGAPYNHGSHLIGFRIALSDNSVPPPSTAMAWWKMDETSGTIVSDSIGGHNGVTINMTKPWVTGYLNNALQLDGINDYVEIAGFTGITGTASRTCAAWIKAAFNSQEQEIISWGNGANGEKWMFRLQPDRRLAVGVWGGYIYSNTTIADSEWHHVAAVLENDGSPSVNEIKLYIDGVAQTGTYNTTQAINTASSQNVQIGSVYNGTNQTSFFSGIIDEVQIYDWALTQDEILQQAMK